MISFELAHKRNKNTSLPFNPKVCINKNTTTTQSISGILDAMQLYQTFTVLCFYPAS
jgi:hypothetical protein